MRRTGSIWWANSYDENPNDPGGSDSNWPGTVARFSDSRRSPPGGRQAQPHGAGSKDSRRQAGPLRNLDDQSGLHGEYRPGSEARRAFVPAVGVGGVQAPPGDPGQGRSTGVLRAVGRAPRARGAVSVQDPEQYRGDRNYLRSVAQLPPDFHGRPQASQGSQSHLDGLLSRPLGRRYLGGRVLWFRGQ